MKKLRNDRLVWCDLETTGLDLENGMSGCQTHFILEIGIHITDLQFNIIDDGLDLIVHHDLDVIQKISDPKAFEFHKKSGLLDKVERSTINLSHAEQLILNYLEQFDIEPKTSPICGNNVSFDKNFLDAQMPRLANFFHYRKIDVSSFKEVFNRLHPENVNLVQKKLKHRALDDIKESIDELKLYKDLYFK